MSEVLKTVFEYDNYRAFLKDYYAHSKLKNKKFSYRYFSKLVGYTSPNFLKCVIDGTRNLTEDGIDRFTTALKLNKDEGLFFKNLVLLNQAKSEEEKRSHASQIVRSRAYRKILPLKEAQFRYLAHWYLVSIRELVGLPGFREDPGWIAQTLIPQITPAQAQRALEELIQLGLLTRNEQGHLVQTSADITTPDEILSAFKADCLVDLIRLGAESIKSIPREKRDISSVTVGVSAEGLEKIKEIAKKFRREVMEVAQKTSDAGDNVYQFNIQLFPLTNISSRKEDS